MRTKTPQTIKRRYDLVIKYEGGDSAFVTYRGYSYEFGHERPAEVRKAMAVMGRMSEANIRKFLGGLQCRKAKKN